MPVGGGLHLYIFLNISSNISSSKNFTFFSTSACNVKKFRRENEIEHLLLNVAGNY